MLSVNFLDLCFRLLHTLNTFIYNFLKQFTAPQAPPVADDEPDEAPNDEPDNAPNDEPDNAPNDEPDDAPNDEPDDAPNDAPNKEPDYLHADVREVAADVHMEPKQVCMSILYL